MGLKLGKRSAIYDKRTIKFASILSKKLPDVPSDYNFDIKYPGCDTPMYLNDRLGDCVIAGRAHNLRRFELIEQQKVITIKDSDVKKEYFKESGGKDSGLNMLSSLKMWRKGWKLNGKIYTIDAFAQVMPTDSLDIKNCIYLLNGCYTGVALPISAQKQVGKIWTITSGPDAILGSWGGHCIYLVAYNIEGPICITWGAYQSMTWEWFAKYCDEAFGIVDNSDKWLKKPGIDVLKLEEYLKEIAT